MKKKISIDGILAFFNIAALGYACYVIYNARSIPTKWRLIGVSLFVILTLLCVALTFKKMPNWGLWVRRIITVLLTVALGLGSFYIAKVGIFTKDVTDVSKDAVTKISVIVKAGSDIKDTVDLEGMRVGYQNATDKESADYVKKKLNKDASKIKYVKDGSYITLAQQLIDEEIDALIISDNFLPTLEEWQEGYITQVKTIKTYTRNVVNKITNGANDAIDLNKDCFTILLSGTDETGDPSHNSRSDVIMLVIVNPVTKQVQLVSFPRDSFVPNPALGYGYDKLTHTGNDGVENTVTAIENVVGFEVDFYVKVNFTSVVEIVDALGGIEVDSPVAFCEQDSQRNFENLQCLEKGVQEVDGEKALAFARHRKTEGVGDIGRTHAQQKIITAMIKKALTAEGISKMPHVLDIVPNYVSTNISQSQLENFISYQLENMGAWTVNQLTLENGYSEYLTTASMGNMPLSCYLLNREDVKKLSSLYYMIYNTGKFNEFSFDLNDLTHPDVKSNYNSKLIYTDSNYSSYLGNETPVEEPDAPVVDVPVDTPPATPETPTTPEEPTTPETPPTTPETPTDPGTGGGNNNTGTTTP